MRFALQTNLANLKTEVDKLDIDKLVPVPVDLSKLSDVVKNDVVMILIGMGTLIMELDLIEEQVFHFQVMIWSKGINFWG